MTDVDVVNNPSRTRFEAQVEGHVAHLDYERHDRRLALVHTEVPDELEGHGLGGRLVSAAIGYAAQHDLVVEPTCPFAAGWLRRHPDTARRVTIDWPPEHRE